MGFLCMVLLMLMLPMPRSTCSVQLAAMPGLVKQLRPSDWVG